MIWVLPAWVPQQPRKPDKPDSSASRKQEPGDVLEVDDADAALLAVLMLRGEQTPGELRTRTARYCEFSSLAEVEMRLDDLALREPALVERLERRPGEKESRYSHLLGTGEPVVPTAAALPADDPDSPGVVERIRALEAEVAELRSIVDRLSEILD